MSSSLSTLSHVGLNVVARNESIRQSLTNSPGSHGKETSSIAQVNDLIKQSTIMTDRGPAVLLQQPPSSSSSSESKPRYDGIPFSGSDDEEMDEDRDSGYSEQRSRERKVEVRSPIAQMLYSRWLMSLREQRQSSLLLPPLLPLPFVAMEIDEEPFRSGIIIPIRSFNAISDPFIAYNCRSHGLAVDLVY